MKHTNGFRRLVCLVLCMAMIASFGITAFAENTEARRGNQNYYSNQGALQEDAFTTLPLGAVQPKEWLKEQLLLQKEGLLGNMQDNYPIYSASNGWRGGNGDTWEKGPYYFRGLTQTAFVLNDEELKAKAMECRQTLEPVTAKWIEGAETMEYINSNREQSGTRITLVLRPKYAKNLSLRC